MYKREQLQTIAQETLELCKTGVYEVYGRTYNLQVQAAIYSAKLICSVPPHKPVTKSQTQIECHNENTVQGIKAFQGTGKTACLNFASARKPGGGFLNGAMAQEEFLAYSSTLYPTLIKFPEFYNQKHKDNTYSDTIIYSPNITFFRNSMLQLAPPIIADVITMAAPNASATRNNITREDIFMHRIQKICTVARQEKVENLILGAWGCGVFKNNPEIVADCFKKCLSEFNFKNVRFSILGPVIEKFEKLQTEHCSINDIDIT